MNLKKWLLFSVPAMVAVLLLVIVAVPKLRERLRIAMNHSEREVLATADGDLLGDGTTSKVIKYRSADQLFIEILKVDGSGAITLIDRILLPDKHDGLFNFQGHVTRLAITDINNDGKFELLAPTFDNQLVPHLNVFRYNSTTGRFELYQPTK